MLINDAIEMCLSLKCPVKEQCHRYVMTPGKKQVYVNFYKCSRALFSCDGYQVVNL